MTDKERLEDLQNALHIAQTDRDKWKTRALGLAKILEIKDCDIEKYLQEVENGKANN